MNVNAEDYFDTEIAKFKKGVALVSPAPRQSLFKYISLNGKTSWERFEKTLTGKLEGTSARYLNDPFEISPVVIDDLRSSTVKAIIGRPPLLDRIEGKLEYDVDYNLLRSEALNQIKNIQRQNHIISFSSRYDSPLLWAHYANGYQGACLQFYANNLFKTNYIENYFVNYNSYRKLYPLSLALSLSRNQKPKRLDRAESDYLIYYQKSQEWSYEEEIRSVYNAQEFPDGLDFDIDQLASIVVGPKTNSKNIKKISDIIKKSNIPNLPIFKASISESSYEITVDFRKKIIT